MGAVPAWHAQRRPGAPALISDEGTLSWQDMADRVAARANALLAMHVAPGDRVAISLPNGFAFIESLFAIWAVGAVPMPLSPTLAVQERSALLTLARPALVIGEGEGPWPKVPVDWTPVPTGAGLPEIAPAQSWKLMASGGSTGRPKLIQAERPALTDPDVYELFPWDMHEGRLGRPDGVMLCPGPLYHNGPLVHAAMNLFAGSTLVLMRRFDAAAALTLIERHRVEFSYLVPTMMRRIMALGVEERNRYDLSSLRGIVHTASACAEDLKRQWFEWLGPERVWETYGSTEAVASTVIGGVDWLAHPGSVGQFFFGAHGAIRNSVGETLPACEVGEIWVRPGPAGPGFRYVGAEPCVRDGWYSFGDLGSMDAEGYLYIADRRDDLIIRGGNNIYPAEVEAALEAHPAIVAAAVIGLPDDDLGARVHAIIQLRAPVSLDTVEQFVRDRLTRHKRPQSFEIVDFDLRDAAGKLRRSALRDKRIADPIIFG
ncbi:MAG: AMP-binding protein [Beijerinckiaceae bacterium]|nr:AMP-binding protein [Beijerinckiaceae bacterium]